jgi:hypothetical protein
LVKHTDLEAYTILLLKQRSDRLPFAILLALDTQVGLVH